MKKQHQVISIATLAMLAGLANAGTMGPVGEQINWTGFYVGGVAGEVWENSSVSWTSLVGDNIAVNTNNNNAFGGVVAGFNYQFNPSWVAGVDTDYSWANIKGLTNTTLTVGGVPLAGSFNTMSSTLNWLPSVRGRLGYLVTPRVLLYFAAGGSWANFSYAASTTNGLSTFATNAGFSRTSSGYNVGAGFDWALSSHFTARVEYVYYNFRSAQNISVVNGGTFSSFAPTSFVGAVSNYTWGNTYMNAARAALTYTF